MSFNCYRRELYDRPKVKAYWTLKVRMMKFRGSRSPPVRLRVVEPSRNQLQQASCRAATGCCFKSSEVFEEKSKAPRPSERLLQVVIKTAFSHTTTLSKGPDGRAWRPPCARGGYCGRGSWPAWATIDCPNRSCSMRGGGRRTNGQDCTPVLSTCPLHTNSGCWKERRIFIGP